MGKKNKSKLKEAVKLFETLEEKLAAKKEIKETETGKIFKLLEAAKAWANGNYDSAFRQMNKVLGLNKDRYPDFNIIPPMQQRLIVLAKKLPSLMRKDLLF